MDDYIKDFDGNKSKIISEYEYVIGKLGIESDFADLFIERLYRLLMVLPEVDSNGTIAKRIYLAIARTERSFSDDDLACQAYKEFMMSGKVYCNTGYQRVVDAWYFDGKNVYEKIANRYNLVEIPKRQNSSLIKRMLGIRKLVLKGEVIGTPETHPMNVMFQKDFLIYKPLAFCYRLDIASKDEVRKFYELEILLCTNLTARYDGKEVELDDYEFILKDSKTFFLKIPRNSDSLDEMKKNVSFSAAIARVICSYIDVTEPFALFRELYGANDHSRRELILQIFEDESIMERARMMLNYQNDTKYEFKYRINGQELNMKNNS